ncbi:19428_t:CDS:1 [Gigaspora rosea]|nr:19428_t:CDS:1 [Gigaspora rosea]
MICRSPQSKPDTFVKLQPFPDPIPKANEDHYIPFCEIHGKDTNETYRPSLLQKANVPASLLTIDGLGANGMGFSPRAQYAANVRVLVKCVECNRPRVLYSQHRLKLKEENLLKNFIETIDYTCGMTFYKISDLTKSSSPSVLTDNIQAIDIVTNDDNDNNQTIDIVTNDGSDNDTDNMEDNDTDSMEDNNTNGIEENVDESPVEQDKVSLETLFKQVFVNAKLTCLTPMEVPYFSSRLYPDVCFQCGNAEVLLPTPTGQQPYCSE